MNQPLPNHPAVTRLEWAAHLLFLVSLVFSLRAGSSMAAGLLVITGLGYNWSQHRSLYHARLRDPFFIACCLYGLGLLLSLCWHPPGADDWRQLQLKSALVAVPLSFCCSGFINANTTRRLLAVLTGLLVVAAAYCLVMAALSGHSSHFFYHELVKPLKQHAVYFSLLVCFTLFFLCESAAERDWLVSKPLHGAALLFLLVFLVLLSSKLVISFFLIYLVFFALKTVPAVNHRRPLTWGIVAILISATALLLITNNPISRRFRELTAGDPSLFRQERFDPSVYFNGLQFRLMQWKLVPGMLDKHDAWMTGVGAGRSQSLLAGEYQDRGMYAGTTGTGDPGYLLYNTHNQLLETLLKYGLPGAALFVLLCLSLVLKAWKEKTRVFSFAVALLLLYTCFEALLETQYGIMIFTYFPFLFAAWKKTGVSSADR